MCIPNICEQMRAETIINQSAAMQTIQGNLRGLSISSCVYNAKTFSGTIKTQVRYLWLYFTCYFNLHNAFNVTISSIKLCRSIFIRFMMSQSPTGIIQLKFVDSTDILFIFETYWELIPYVIYLYVYMTYLSFCYWSNGLQLLQPVDMDIHSSAPHGKNHHIEVYVTDIIVNISQFYIHTLSSTLTALTVMKVVVSLFI